MWLPAPCHCSCLHWTAAGCGFGLDLQADLLSEGFRLLQLIPCTWEEAVAGSTCLGWRGKRYRRQQEKGVLMPKRGLARALQPGAFCLHGITILLSKKIRIKNFDKCIENI